MQIDRNCCEIIQTDEFEKILNIAVKRVRRKPLSTFLIGRVPDFSLPKIFPL